jgi:hypothetical protein
MGLGGGGIAKKALFLLQYVHSKPHCMCLFYGVLEKQRKNREKKQIRQQNKKRKGKKNKDSKKTVSSNVRIDGFENTDANL